MKIGARSVSVHFDHTVLAALIARRWKQNRPYFTLSRRAPGPWLQGQCLMVRNERFTSRSLSASDLEAAAVGD